MRLALTKEQQLQMRLAYYGGAPGILVSGLVWVIAALVCYRLGINKAVWTLLIGGALIHPIGTIVTKALGRSAKTDKGNALTQLAMASTIWLILCCAMAYGLFLLKPELFFPAMMATIGSRYLIFATVFGKSIFWGLGATLLVAASLAYFLQLSPSIAAGLGALVEILFAFLAFSKATKPAV